MGLAVAAQQVRVVIEVCITDVVREPLGSHAILNPPDHFTGEALGQGHPPADAPALGLAVHGQQVFCSFLPLGITGKQLDHGVHGLHVVNHGGSQVFVVLLGVAGCVPHGAKCGTAVLVEHRGHGHTHDHDLLEVEAKVFEHGLVRVNTGFELQQGCHGAPAIINDDPLAGITGKDLELLVRAQDLNAASHGLPVCLGKHGNEVGNHSGLCVAPTRARAELFHLDTEAVALHGLRDCCP